MATVARRAKIAQSKTLLVACFAMLAAMSAPAAAQSARNSAGIDSDLSRPDGASANPPPTSPPPYVAPSSPYPGQVSDPAASPQYPHAQAMATGPASSMCGRQNPDGTYQTDDLIGAAEGVFGTGARGLASVIKDILNKQGKPNGYIAGREAGGAFAVGLRYGSGTLCQREQGPLPVYWTGPSIGFDVGANAAKTFVLVYNLNNTDDLFHRFGAGEGQAYFIGGFNVSYMRRGNVVLIPVRLGVGVRLGINGGYMKMSRRQNWFPF